ncbi:BTB/POZ domain-containing protein [Rhizophagus irregularis DAOM 181602=DAOM 197198]|nr:BTB/POZ domain-containing protein [Rhizophagus irregularis DAOM 181602=DAOM 197198]
MSFEYSQELANDYEKLFETDEGYDVIIYAGDNENVKEIHAFSNILRIRSQYFRTVLSNELTNKKDGNFIFNFPNITPQFFEIILRKQQCVYDSVIIYNKHFDIFSGWIEKKIQFYYNLKNIPYNFNLLYRASRDGNTTSDFYTKCDNKGATIVIAKITNSNQIVGGYISLQWDLTDKWKSTKDCFIFSFANKDIL